MSGLHQKDIRNRLLAALPADEFGLLSSSLERVTWTLGDRIIEPNEPCDFAFFPEQGLMSQIAITTEGRRLEVGIYGRDGMGPSNVVLGVDRSPCMHIVQGKGYAYRLPVSIMMDVMEKSIVLRPLLLRFVQVYMTQTNYTAVSNGSNIIGQRLARWILMTHDRLEMDDLSLTHEFLGVMLGVRRSGVTEAIHVLEGSHVIKATRGNIRVINRPMLEQIAGDSYGVPEAEYERLIGTMR
ncbi:MULTISPECIES: Crp/Fnr family transcriptional regulator [Lichenihabitans]|uniref:Crp/Fnr family transcriptional regulator n=1 Tax=Lichenihabitans TaxID=2723776 RepID=UPI001D0BDE33|nr:MULTISPECIES: Crp/Fnr family transcriptional regulator [Lichenihabitans]UDL93556.1 Crp/Fnr family transcriptional regulator [Lichenihabitans sp. PAMC28606]